ncbi:hypothetical protein MBAV_000057 [Candidatus Magnetobacterium bavaricum]|uniref:Uncharacterized protein n=1 Tax=Candidatus Magnetobacterium bavaricum TaxID=29290 RepID=A0A0F3H464_9BACT|nr:hypothetical protein MBAV_000057 [Candidatus Magnetobacterium bavaricum]
MVAYVYVNDHKLKPLLHQRRKDNTALLKKLRPCALKIGQVLAIVHDTATIGILVVYLYI